MAAQARLASTHVPSRSVTKIAAPAMSSTASSRRRASCSDWNVELRTVTLRPVRMIPRRPGTSSRFVAVVSMSTQEPSAARRRQSDQAVTLRPATKLITVPWKSATSRGCSRSARCVPGRSSRPSSRSSDGLTSWITPSWSITATASEHARTIVSQRAGASVPIIVLLLLERADDR